MVADGPFNDLRSYLQVNMPVWTGLPNVPFTWTIMALLPAAHRPDVDQVSPVAVIPACRSRYCSSTDGDTAIPADGAGGWRQGVRRTEL